MDDEPHNGQSNSVKSADDGLINTCMHCQHNPCVCSGNVNGSQQKILGETITNGKKHPKTKPRKICWI